ncbi:MAG: exo-alpha-sialidase [Saprospiraceae bacterium]|nr:exo-alpha-sialidase [Saprospiraceae bacterium]
MKFLSFILCVLMAGASACAQSKKAARNAAKFQNIMIAEAKQGDPYGPCEPTICVNLKNTNQIAAGAILNRYYWSEDGGRQWQAGKLSSDYGVFGDPVIIADWKGNFYYAHLSDPEKGGWSSEKLLDRIALEKSTDGGKTYAQSAFMGMRHPKDQDKHWLCADPKTHALICSWTEFDKYDSKDTVRDRSRILFSRSDDGGKTWADAISINQYDGDCLDGDNTPEGAVPAFGPNGEVYVAWSWNNKIWFDRSLDGGKTWLPQDIVVADQPGGWAFDIPGITRCNGMPVLVCDLSNGPNRGTLYVNWADQRNGTHDTDVFFAKSTDGGKTWSKAQRVNDDPAGKHQFLTWMAIDQTNGYLYFMFYDRRKAGNDAKTEVYLAVSQNGGKTFKNMKVSANAFEPNEDVFFGDYNHISAHDGIIRPIWTRMDGKKLSIWTAIIDFKNPPIIDNQD